MSVSQRIYDVVVGASGHRTTLSAAKDVLRDNSTMYVKRETFSEGGVVTFPQENIEVFVEPYGIVDDGLTFEAPGVHLHLGKGAEIQGKLTFEEQYGSIQGSGGNALEEVEFQNHYFFIDGGGWDTILSDRLHINGGNFGHVRNLSIDTKTGATGNYALYIPSGQEIVVEKVLIRDSDLDGIYTGTVSVVNSLLVIDCVILQTDGTNIRHRGTTPRTINNRCLNAGQAGAGDGIAGNNLSIYGPCIGNLVRNPATNGIHLPTGAVDWTVVANRVEPGSGAAIVDTPGSSTIAHNKETAY